MRTSPRNNRRNPGRSRHAFLSREAEYQLAVQWRDDRDGRALDQLVDAHEPLVAGLAKRFRSYGVSEDDLKQEGRIGLLQAAKKFDPDRGLRFNTYAAWWVRSSIQDCVFRSFSIVGVSATLVNKRLFFQCRSVYNKLEALNPTWSRDRLQAEVAFLLGASQTQVAEMSERLTSAPVSLDATVGDDDDGKTFKENLVDQSDGPAAFVERLIDGERLSARLRRALNKLNDRERAIIKARWLSDDRMTFDALGKVFGISHERVRQIEAVAFETVKAAVLGLPRPRRSSPRRSAAA